MQALSAMGLGLTVSPLKCGGVGGGGGGRVVIISQPGWRPCNSSHSCLGLNTSSHDSHGSDRH